MPCNCCGRRSVGTVVAVFLLESAVVMGPWSVAAGSSHGALGVQRVRMAAGHNACILAVRWP